MKRKFIIGAIIIVLVVFYLSRSVFQKAFSPKPQIVYKIGYMAFASNWPLFLAQEGKFFDKEGIHIEMVKFASGVEGASAMSKGDIASMVVNPLTDLMNIEARQPDTFRIYAMQESVDTGNYTDTMLVKSDSSLRSLSDLKGKKIGVNPGTFAEGLIKILMEQNVISDVTYVQLAPSLQLAALQSSQVDALVAYEPATTLSLTDGTARVLHPHPFESVINPFPNVAFTISTKFLMDNKKDADRIILVMENAIIYGRSHAEEANMAAAKYVGIPANILNKLRYPNQVLGIEIDKKKVQEVVNLFSKYGLAPKDITVAPLFYLHDPKTQ